MRRLGPWSIYCEAVWNSTSRHKEFLPFIYYFGHVLSPPSSLCYIICCRTSQMSSCRPAITQTHTSAHGDLLVPNTWWLYSLWLNLLNLRLRTTSCGRARCQLTLPGFCQGNRLWLGSYSKFFTRILLLIANVSGNKLVACSVPIDGRPSGQPASGKCTFFMHLRLF